MNLPKFRYHPDPIASGSIVRSDNECVCCGEARGFIYTGSVSGEEELEEALCPWCIADGSAHDMFDAEFADGALIPEDIAPGVVEELCHRTPAFKGWQREQWLTCCGDGAEFIAPVGRAELRAHDPQFESALLTYVHGEFGLPNEAATRVIAALNRDRGPTAYLFRCRHCGNKLGYVDGSDNLRDESVLAGLTAPLDR
jgi:uncharacterized protein